MQRLSYVCIEAIYKDATYQPIKSYPYLLSAIYFDSQMDVKQWASTESYNVILLKWNFLYRINSLIENMQANT